MISRLFILCLILFSINSCNSKTGTEVEKPPLIEDAYNAAFLIMDGVYNTELTAPYDIFQHTKYRKGIKPINVFTVADKNTSVTSFEGLRILPDYNYLNEKLPHIDILVIPSAEHHLDTDLENEAMIKWVIEISEKASYVTSHCDGAFVLAEAGLLDKVASTTFPSDIAAYKERYPRLDVKEDVLFVHDGKYVTSAGGAKSFEAALYLCEHLYGKEIAQRLAGGLVIDWDLEMIKKYVAE